MGAGAAAGLTACAGAVNEAEVQAALASMPKAERDRLIQMVTPRPGGGGGGASRLGRPPLAVGPFLRVVTVNDVYKLDNYPRLATAIKEFKDGAAAENAVCVSTLPGDFLSPCTLTNLDGGVAMLRALNESGIDYVMFGNHEFDLKTPQLQKRILEYNGTWINSNVSFPTFVDRNGKALPEYEIIKVGDKKVALTAYLLDDMSQFAPIEPMPKISKPTEALATAFAKIKAAEGGIHAFLPMLHVNIKEDRAVGEFIAKQEEIAKITPVILASHDHEVYIEEAGKSLIFKVGADAENIGVIDLYWDESGALRRNVHMIAAQDFVLEPRNQAFVKKELDMMSALMDVGITEIPNIGKKLSTARVRFEMEPLVSHLLSVTKKSMQNVEMVFLQGGNVRGGTPKYEPGSFTYGDLMKEFAFDTQMAIVKLPGKIIKETIKNSRTPEGTKPFFLHCDAEAEFDADGLEMLKIAGAPLEPERMYTVSTYQFLLCGMGNLEPMSAYCKENNTCPPLEACPGIKNFFMETCMNTAWLKIMGFDGSAKVSDAEFEAAIEKTFNDIDKNGDGQLDPKEVAAFLEKSGVVSAKLVNFLISAFDMDSDGFLSRAELQALAH